MDFSGIDYSRYHEWEQVKGAGGQTYYIIPGAEGYVYDPFLSGVKKRPVIWVNPTASQQKQEQAQKNAEKIQNAQLKQLDPVNQLIPVAGTVGGLYAANKLLNPAGVAAATPAAPTIAGGSPGIIDSVTTGAGDIVNSVSNMFGGGNIFTRPEIVPSLPTSLGEAASGSAGAAWEGAKSVAGSVPTDPSLLADSPVGIAGQALGAYGLYDTFANQRHGGRGALQAGTSAYALTAPLGPQISIPVALAAAALGYFGNFGDKDMWKTEGNRLDDLIKQGYKQIPLNKNRLTHGQSKEELIAQGKALSQATGNPNYEKFAETRDENYITPEALSTHATTIEHGGVKGNQQSRFKDAQDAVNAQKALGNVIREHHGTIDVDWEKVKKWKEDHDPKGPQKKNDATKVTGPINKAKPNKAAPVYRSNVNG